MKSLKPLILLLSIALITAYHLEAQITSSSSNIVALPMADRSVLFNVTDTGVSKPMTFGLDLAWLDGNNVRRGIAFMGKERVGIIRSSFMPTNPLVGDTALQGEALTNTNKRLDIIHNYMGPGTKIMLNDDNPTVHADFFQNPVNWTKLMEITAKYHEKRGFNVVSVAPFNEPDNTGAGQGTVQDFYNICVEVKKNPYFNGKRLSGPNMLNTDVFFNWYNPLKNIVDEGNTHQLAGNFDNYALIFQTIRANGQHATNDEMHNVMEAMVGVEYGMQTGIWWGTADLARGEFAKASDGKRLAYAEHRINWTSAAVYKHPNGKIQAFGGSSERQAATTTYRFVSKERDVFYDGYGPQREYMMELPGGEVGSYSKGQVGAERVVNITWGDDIQPVIDGRYKLVNRKSGKVMELANGATNLGANIQQNTYQGSTHQQWNVTPIDSRIGGDFSYFKISNVNNGLCPDVSGFSLENGGNIISYSLMTVNQQWYLEYAGEGWFYIRSRHSNKCIEVANSSTYAGANIQQWEKNGGANQQWRFMPVGVTIEFVAPSAPVNLVATANVESVRLDWTASPDNDVAGYTIFRSDSAGGNYQTIARNVKSTSFVDNTTTEKRSYHYAIKAVDNALNISAYSNPASATTVESNVLVSHFPFEGSFKDSTINLNHGALFGTASYVTGKTGTQALSLNGVNHFLQLPATLANHKNLTIATWVYWNGSTGGQRIFDFGNDPSECMYLSPKVALGGLRFAITKGGVTHQLNAKALPTGKWIHLAVTLSNSVARLYVDGIVAAESNSITISPLDIKPVLNYIGRSQSSYPLFNGLIDDFRVYNHALSAVDVEQLAGIPSIISSEIDSEKDLKIWPSPANAVCNITTFSENSSKTRVLSVYKPDGTMMVCQKMQDNQFTLNTSGYGDGLYILKITDDKNTRIKKFVVRH